MQNFKQKFLHPDGSQLATLQTCIRTNDLDSIGNGTHLSSFQMLGNFHFGHPEDKFNYEHAIEIWHEIITLLKVPITSIHVHPSQHNHKQMWLQKGYIIEEDESCVWSDGNIGGFCCEMYCGDLEVGNLVNTLGYSVDVGIGLERLQMVLENKNKVDETSLFDTSLPPIVRDIDRTLSLFWEYQIAPGWKGRNQVCRNLLRKVLHLNTDTGFLWSSWVVQEKQAIENKLKTGRRVFYRYREQSKEWFHKTYGISSEEYDIIREEFTENGIFIRKTKDG